MALAFDNSSSGLDTSASVTVSHTATGSDLIAIALIWSVSGGSDDLDTVTYDGNAMTLITKATGIPTPYLYAYYYIGPATGAKDVVATKTGDSGQISMAVHTYTGALQSGQPDASIYESVNVPGGQALTKNITTIADNCWLVAIGSSPSTLNASTGSTEREALTTLLKSFDSNGAKNPAGVHSMSFTFGTDADPFRSILLSIAPKPNYTLAMGIGAFVLTGVAVDLLRTFLLTAVTGVFTLTGIVTGLIKSSLITIGTGVFTLTGNAINFVLGGWDNVLKSVSIFSNETKNSAPSYTNETKTSSSWTNETKNIS